MKVVSRKDFLKFPDGTAFIKGRKWCFDGGLCFKVESLANDWRYQAIDMPDANDSGELFDLLDEMLMAGVSHPMEYDSTRDGCFNDDDLFLIYEADDLKRLHAMIGSALEVAS